MKVLFVKCHGRSAVLGIAFLITLLGLRTSCGQAIHDAGTWMSVNFQGDVHSADWDTSRLKWWFDGHLRLFDDADGYGQSIARPAVGYQLRDNLSVWLGYGWINETPPGLPNFDENRIFQQLLWSEKIGRTKFTSRTRLEQRFVETGSNTGWRFRQFNKLLRPFEYEPRMSAIAWDEVFFDLNSTDWGQHGSFSQNRVFTGLGWTFDQLPNQPRIEVGYMHQYIRKRSADDKHNHIVGINWFANF